VEKAKQLAGDDYVVLVADVYGKGVRPKTDAEAGPVATKLRNDRPLLRARALEAVNVLRAQAGKVPLDAGRIGAVGFCFGGTTVLELARAG
ncbi:dienelactone hydrolase family protein, partial [Mycobacterium tuberculosis]|nr:dienelactone hydrolase family protein [Mycobacterium tuberculosis]